MENRSKTPCCKHSFVDTIRFDLMTLEDERFHRNIRSLIKIQYKCERMNGKIQKHIVCISNEDEGNVKKQKIKKLKGKQPIYQENVF